MPRRFVRESKFRHVYGDPFKRTACYDNINVSKNTWDGGNYCAVNSKFLAFVMEGNGVFSVIPVEKTGRMETNLPKVSGHKGNILDIQFNPFNTHVLATAGEDSRIKIWELPEEGVSTNMTESKIDLIGHRKKVGIIQWHPAAENILASTGFDYDVIVWNVENGSPVHVVTCHDDVINALVWNRNGSLLASTSKDRKARIIDPRKGDVIHKFTAHNGNKPSRVFFVDDSRLVTVGCAKDATREIALWNVNHLEEPVIKTELDQGSGNLLATFDDTLNILYIGVKGDCMIRYFEISKESPYIHFLSQYSSTTPQRCFGVLPKRAVNVATCEIYRLYKIHSKGLCEPISMVVPRRSENFQTDIYPDVPGDMPALTAEQWLDGKDVDPLLISLKEGFKATKKEFTVTERPLEEENIFHIHMNQAPKREEDLRTAFYKQQDEIQKLQELLKAKELRLRQLEYENSLVKKCNVNQVEVICDITPPTNHRRTQISNMIVEDSDCFDDSTDDDEDDKNALFIDEDDTFNTVEDDISQKDNPAPYNDQSKSLIKGNIKQTESTITEIAGDSIGSTSAEDVFKLDEEKRVHVDSTANQQLVLKSNLQSIPMIVVDSYED